MNFKRITALLMTVLLVFSLTACGGKEEAEPEMAPVFEESLDTIYTEMCELIEDEETREFLKGFGVGEINEENAAYYIGSADVEYTEAIFAEPMMSSIAFSVCIVRAEEGADIEAQKKLIEENVDPIKWICVEAESVKTVNVGNVILLVMADEARAVMVTEAFEALNAQ